MQGWGCDESLATFESLEDVVGREPVADSACGPTDLRNRPKISGVVLPGIESLEYLGYRLHSGNIIAR